MPETEQSANADASDDPDLSNIETVVDIDAQIQEDIEEIAGLIPDRDPTGDIIRMTKSARSFVYSGLSTFNMYAYKRAGKDGTPRLADEDPSETIRPDAVEKMRDDLGIDVGIINPTVNLGLAEMNNQRFAVALARAYNDWIISELDGHSELVANMVVAPHEPEQAAEEIDRIAVEKDIVGVELPATGMTPPPGHKQYWPIYETAESHGLPISMHGVVGMKSFHQQFYSSKTFAEDFVNHPSFVQMRNIDSIVFEGIPEFFPNLDFIVNGMGLGFAPYIISRMDDHYLELGYEIPALEQMPNKYFDESFYWGTKPLNGLRGSPDYIAKNIEILGAENVMFGSDIPHPVSDQPKDALAAIERYFDDGTVNKIMGGTAAQVHGL